MNPRFSAKEIKSVRLIIQSLIFILLSHAAFSQVLTNPVKALHDDKEFIFGIDNRITKLNNRIGVIYGLYLGVGYGNNLRFKFSFSGTPFSIGKVNPNNSSNQISRLLFASIGQEFDFLTIGKFKLTTYVNAGIGYHYFKIVDQENTQLDKGREPIRPLELGIHGRYQINPLFAIKVGGGYRFVFPAASDDLSGSYLKLTAVINPKELKRFMQERKSRRND